MIKNSVLHDITLIITTDLIFWYEYHYKKDHDPVYVAIYILYMLYERDYLNLFLYM